MTREEAIKLIEHISIAFVPTDQYGDYDDPQPYEEALDMAIEALQNLSKPNNGLQVSDLISRQDAIEAIAKRIYHIEDGNENDALRKAICDIDALPSVNAIPYDSTVTLNSPTIIKATSTDLISRQDAINEIKNVFDDVLCCNVSVRKGLPEAARRIEMMPSAEPKTGKWINRENCQVDEDAYEVAICSECGAEITIEYPYDIYCPNCGAKVGGDIE